MYLFNNSITDFTNRSVTHAMKYYTLKIRYRAHDCDFLLKDVKSNNLIKHIFIWNNDKIEHNTFLDLVFKSVSTIVKKYHAEKIERTNNFSGLYNMIANDNIKAICEGGLCI